MSTSLFFNLSFDLGGISLILFVVWFFVNFNNSAAAFKWFSLSILALLASVIILSYGATKLAKVRSSLPSQNQTEIINLKQEVSDLKSKQAHHSKTTTKEPKATKSHHKSHKKTEADEPAVPSRIVNETDNQIVKTVVEKHPHHINLVAKVTNQSQPMMVRGVHSNQTYKIHGKHDPITVGEFVVIKGTATKVDSANTIHVTSTSVKKQVS
ncbi:hypothetical protein [Acetilactobacillus jinshanensis]|uniref:Uncharacterized protein n=1 Tax=Acetilactobacillus jinshanensis TaxID=1720083 RepID=A0A4P6ZJ44_9LACO|nr:hypothetical protein [Acetilactobacillus jinshanensis]QBP17741.1 hypothetical protein ELX58_00805 [Acetilactobacillus jinshanensis]URL60604.1 hypothetical protein HGK75_00820 [uncultured bacterium]